MAMVAPQSCEGPMPNDHPYKELGPRHFWKTSGLRCAAQGQKAPIPDFWRPKWPLNQTQKFVTLGSCFAQRIGPWLKDNGYDWHRAGQGPYSFDTGTIYTAAMLKAWLQLALNNQALTIEDMQSDGRFYDSMRPTCPEIGFESQESLNIARQKTLTEIGHGLKECDVFIFTLGLTEAWINQDGFVHALCPGTVVGSFDADHHHFHQYRFAEIYGDLKDSFALLRAHNPHMKFILSVSPVPLTATMSPDHVLSATLKAKSTLRAVAGELAQDYDDIDYFPSYELISSFVMGAQFYEPNLRSVRADGVSWVMKHWALGLSDPSPQPINAHSVSDDSLCDEYRLDSSAPDHHSQTLCLIGDSHMSQLSQALRVKNIHHCGGMIMNGSAWRHNLLHFDEDELFVPLENAKSRQDWDQIKGFFKGENHHDKTVITNIGMQSHQSVTAMIEWLNAQSDPKIDFEKLYAYYQEANKPKLQIIATMVKKGFKVIALTDPPTQSINPEIGNLIDFWVFYDQVVSQYLSHLGVQVLNARAIFDLEPFLASYFSDIVYDNGTKDWFHGSNAYYARIADIIHDRFLSKAPEPVA